MGEPVWAVARLLAELPPFLAFLATLPSEPAQDNEGLSLQEPADFWQAAADEAIQELRSPEQPTVGKANEKKATVRQLLRRAQRHRRLARQLSADGGRLELLRTARATASRASGGAQWPPSVQEVVPGLLAASGTVGQDAHAGNASPPWTPRQQGVDEELYLCDVAEPAALWGSYRLFEDRLMLQFDQGRTILVRGSSEVLTSHLYGMLVRCWHLLPSEAEEFLQELGFNAASIPEAFRSRLHDAGAASIDAGSSATQRPRMAAALGAHLRMLWESHRWPPQQAAALLRSTEAAFAQALRWEVRRHSSASSGMVCAGILRALGTELAASVTAAESFQQLLCVTWKHGERSAREEVIVLEPDAVPSEGSSVLAAFRDSLFQELRGAVALPQLLIVSLEASRPFAIPEAVRLDEFTGGGVYHVFALLSSGIVATRDPKKLPGRLPGCSVIDDNGLLLSDLPAMLVLVHERLAPASAWTPWARFLEALEQPSPAEVGKTFKLAVLSIAQHDAIARGGSCFGIGASDMLGVVELPTDAKVSLLQRRITSQFHLPTTWQWILAPCSAKRAFGGGWQFLPPAARVADFAIPLPGSKAASSGVLASGGSGSTLATSFAIVLGIQRPEGNGGSHGALALAALQAGVPGVAAAAAAAAGVPGYGLGLGATSIPVLSRAWINGQLLTLDVVVLDARRTLASYSEWVAQRLDEEVGPCTNCSAFIVYELATNPDAQASSHWRPLRMDAPLAAETIGMSATKAQIGANEGAGVPLPIIVWEPLPLARSATRQGALAAHEAACLPDLEATEKQFPLERLVAQKSEELGLALRKLPGATSSETPSAGLILEAAGKAWEESEEYATLLLMEERLLVAWVEDFSEGVVAIAAEARRRLDAAVERLRAAVAAQGSADGGDPPPGLKEWPSEPAEQWSGRLWEKVCRGAAALQAWALPAPNTSDTKVAQGLVWAEITTLQDIVLSLDVIRFNFHGHCVLRGTVEPCSSGDLEGPTVLGPRSTILGATFGDVAAAERRHYTALLSGDSLDPFFGEEIEDLPGDCDEEVAGLNALVQTTNAELNSLWRLQRQALLAGEEAQFWRAVRLRELSLSALFLLVKQAQASTKFSYGLELEWLQHVQRGCVFILRKSQLICEAASVLAGTEITDEEAAISSAEELAAQLAASSSHLEELIGAVGDESSKGKAEEELVVSDRSTLFGSLRLLALERQLEASATAPPRALTKAMKAIRGSLHTLTTRAMRARSVFDLPLVDDAASTFAAGNQRRGRKLRNAPGRHSRRSATAQQDEPGPGGSVAIENGAKNAERLLADEAAAEAEAKALLRLEDCAAAAAASKAAKRRQRQAAKKSNGAKVQAEPTSIVDTKATIIEKEKEVEVFAEKAGLTPLECKLVAKSLAQEEYRDEPEAESFPDSSSGKGADEKTEADADETLLLERGPFELLHRCRRARLLELQTLTGARCTLDRVGQAVRLQGAAAAVALAREHISELCSEWVSVDGLQEYCDLFLTQGQGNVNLARLQRETRCGATADAERPRVRVAGTPEEVAAAKEWMLHFCCEQAERKATAIIAPSAVGAAPAPNGASTGAGKAKVAKPQPSALPEQRRSRSWTREPAVRAKAATATAAPAVASVAAPATNPTNMFAESSAAKGGPELCGGADCRTPSPEPGQHDGHHDHSFQGHAAATMDADSWQWQVPAAAAAYFAGDVDAAGGGAFLVGDCVPYFGEVGDASGLTYAATDPSAVYFDGDPAPYAFHGDEYAGAFGADFNEAPASSLAEQLAKEFPSARIIVGAPEALQEALPLQGQIEDNRLEAQMRRLGELLDRSRSEKLLDHWLTA
eukprot:TRINITY_DN27815_c0_g1_i1.p1 TRINITY_DN27815_c0_g1~~TRINITY_DN27815_c0_g1_i1.p1  ORF type:complete len:1835 (-),score=414.23 TRINITY_DN27815_c0_g1_i1:114-5618(-)